MSLYHLNILKAETVYLLMRKDYRISRNVRAQWFLDHVNTTMTFGPKEELSERNEELTLISVVPSDPPAGWRPEISTKYKYLITLSTNVIFLAEKYRMVFCLDVSPSLSAVDVQLGEVMIDGMFKSLKRSLDGLTRNFFVPGSMYLFQPDVYVTIIAHTPFFTSPAQQVLVQGWRMTSDNLPILMSLIEQQLLELEGRVAEVSGIAQEQLEAMRAENEKLVGALFEESLQNPIPTENPMVSPDTGFINMLRFGMLALKLLPDSSSANIIVVTDGIINIPDINVFDSVLSQLRSSTVACSFIQVSGPYHPYCCKGFVPYTELMQFMASATLGAYISSAPPLEYPNQRKINIYHTAFLTWSFQYRIKEFASRVYYKGSLEWKVSKYYKGGDKMLIRKKHSEDTLNTSLRNVLSCRLREGYTIKSVQLLDTSQMEVCLVLPWKNNIFIEYSVTSPNQSTIGPVHYVVTIEAPYEFLHDITCRLKKPFKSHYRQAVVGRFWIALKTLAHTDQLLVHLHSFTTNVASHTPPESIRNGMPLFYFPANSSTPVLSTSDSMYPQFSSFWKPVCLLDAAVWQKWLHPHRVGFLLQHDHPLPRYLHQANPSGRFQQVQCRQAASVLFATLKAWSSFVLIENHSYVKLIQGEAEKTPSSFLIVRATSKPPCVVLDMAFLGGASGKLRFEIIEGLKKKISSLTLPQRPLAKDSIIRKVSTAKNPVPIEESKPVRTADAAAVTWSDLNCCILFSKPVEKILIRYERMPSDFNTVIFPDGTQPLAGKPICVPIRSSMLTTLSRYLHHRRWIWVAQPGINSSVTAAALTRTLSTITKMRIQEGFNFAHSTAGIINMLLEVDMKANVSDDDSELDSASVHPCVIQYVLFPPYLINIRESGSDEDCTEEIEVPEGDGELQIITECWIEPQYGCVVNSPQERFYMEGLSYDQLADEICKVDSECISSLLTFEHLAIISQDGAPAVVPVPKPDRPVMEKSDSYYANMKMLPEQRINFMPFSFNIMNLLPKCQQAELLFPVFIQDLSWAYPINSDFEGFSYLDSPNKLLFEMVFENLQRIHGTDLYLSPEDSHLLVDLLQKRERDPKIYYPLPLPFQSPKVTYSRWASKRVRESAFGESARQRVPKCAMWKCFIKRISQTHVILTFVPASYLDLKLLMLTEATLNDLQPKSVKFFKDNVEQNEEIKNEDVPVDSVEIVESAVMIPESKSAPDMQEKAYDPPTAELPESYPMLLHGDMDSHFRVRASSLDTMAKKPGIIELRKRSRTSSMDSRHKKKFSLQPLSPPRFTLDGIHSKESSTPEPQKLKIPANHKPKFGAITLPIYVYDCPLSSLIDVLVYKEHEKRPKDIYEDCTYSRLDEELINQKEITTNLLVPTSNTSPEPKSEESETSKEKKWLEDHCKSLKMLYSRSFVLSLFKSLQLSHFIHSNDVQLAVSECEESVIEIDITKFMQAVCGHLKDFWQRKNIEQLKTNKNDDDFVPEKLQLSVFQQTETCDRLQALHLLIKNKFAKILTNYFHVVPANNDFLYCAPNWERERRAEFQNDLYGSDLHHGEHDLFESEYRSDNSKIHATPLGSQSWERGSNATLDTRTSESVSDLPDEDSSQELCPLFLHVVCSVNVNDKLTRRPVSVLPTCLGEFTSCLQTEEADVDVSTLSVYLDVQCLTLPAADAQIIENVMSTSATQDNQTSNDDNANNEDNANYEQLNNEAVTDNDNDVSPKESKSESVYKKLGNLPDYQLKATASTIHEVKWFLQDEMSAFLLDIFPLTESTLDMVARHIEKSHGRSSCLVERVPLQFVYGPQHSLDKFLHMFSSMTFNGYFLKQEGKYYYLVQDHSATPLKKSSLAVPHGMISIATPSSLADDNSELWNLCYPAKQISGLYSDSELQIMGMLENTPTDESVVRPCTDSKVQSPLVEGFKTDSDHYHRRERKISNELGGKSEARSLFIEDTWIESSSSNVPTPNYEQLERDDICCGPMNEGILTALDMEGDIWDGKGRTSKQSIGKSEAAQDRDSPVPYSRHHNLRFRHNSGAPSTTGPNSEVSSLVESGQGTEDGYEGDSSNGNSVEDLTGDWYKEPDGKCISLPNFWLIMEVTETNVVTYFHCRLTGQEEHDILLYKDTRTLILQKILSICKLVNQLALLQNLNSTRVCDDLLEPENSNEFWKQGSLKSKAHGSTDKDRDVPPFLPGSLACNVVWETQFFLHPRLKTGQAKRGVQALKQVLGPLSVSNRKNMFVYQDNSGNVFYLRLQESAPSIISTSKLTPTNIQAKSTDGEATPPGGSSVSRSPSVSSLMSRKTPVDDILPFKMETRPRVRSFGERDSNIDSPQPIRPEDSVVLKVHGISNAGAQIKTELVQALQNRLADAVLELLCVMLSRNPMCMLAPEDVHFIQKPNQGQHALFEFTIQPHALSHLPAMIHYLRQNLLQFLHLPKYTDNKAENHFQDYSKPPSSKERVQEEDIFLYNQTAACGNRGMACIALAVVDYKGHIVQQLDYTRPSADADLDIFFKADFSTLTATKPYNSSSKTAATHIEFRIWKQGRVNMDLLSKKLQSAVQHSIWDLLMEFNFLTAPLAVDGPHAVSADKISEAKDAAVTLDKGAKREISFINPPAHNVDKFEAGECGQLHYLYQNILCQWLNFAIEIGVPAVKKHTVSFKSRQPLAVSLKEMQRLVGVNASDTTVAVFRVNNKDNDEHFVPYHGVPTCCNETRWDDANSSNTCLLVGRNLNQWKACISDASGFEPDVLFPKAQKQFQKFAPLLVTSNDASSPSPSKTFPANLHFVPRQRLLVATLSDTQVLVLTYNWSKDRSENLNTQVSNLGNWLVSRSSLNLSIINQKMGLFQNQPYNRQFTFSKKGMVEQGLQMRLSVLEVEQLIKSPAAAQKDFVTPGRRANTVPTVCIQDAFRDNKPSKHTMKPSLDSVSYNGQQLLELCTADKKDSRVKLNQLWQTRVTSPHIPVYEDVLHLLKQQSRVIHFCLTPLLFLPSWRIQAAATRDHTLAPASGTPKHELQEMKSLSSSQPRNESGNSLKSNDGERSLRSGTSPQSSPHIRLVNEDKWHQTLCTHFFQEYKQYLQTLGFIPVQVEATSPKKGSSKTSAASTATGSTAKADRQRKLSGPAVLISSSQVKRRKDECHFLQKSLLGGILIFEVTLNEPFFQAKLHAVECSRLQSKTSTDLLSQFTFSFLDECDKIKILMHLHSFTYDYHLRSIHNYISNQQTILRNSFHIRNFLDDFLKYYSKGPNFARNLVYSDIITVNGTSTPAQQLYNFLWTHEDLYQMEVCCMSPEIDYPIDTENEYVLVQLKNTHHITYKDNQDMKHTDDFDITLIVAHENLDGGGNNTLNLKFYIILTSRREHFPKHVIERKLGKFCAVPLPPASSTQSNVAPPVMETESTSDAAKTESGEETEEDTTPVPPAAVCEIAVPHVEIKQEAVNYMGYYSSHEQIMQQLIFKQACAVREQVLTMVDQGMVHCRTHILWETLLGSPAQEDKSKRRDLTYDEFCELLKMASIESLTSLDQRLGPLMCQSVSWYQNLDKVVACKYGTDVIRRYSSADGTVQYTCVLSSNYLEAFAMLSVDTITLRGELSIVCKKTPQLPETNFNVLNNFKLLSPSLQTLIEGFINACCFHLWAGLF